MRHGLARMGALLPALAIAFGVDGMAARPAQAAAIILSLNNVSFDDGGTATGDFGLNIVSYLTIPLDIATNGATFPAAQHYTNGAVAGTPPTADFVFSSAGYVFELHLEFTQTVGATSSGVLQLVPGGGTFGSFYTGSYEVCVFNADVCGVPYGTARFITAGEALVPEPASLSLLAGGFGMLALRRRRRPG